MAVVSEGVLIRGGHAGNIADDAVDSEFAVDPRRCLRATIPQDLHCDLRLRTLLDGQPDLSEPARTDATLYLIPRYAGDRSSVVHDAS